MIKISQLFRTYNKACDKVSNSTKKELIAKNSIMEKKLKYLKTKRKIYEGKINTNFMIMECIKKGLVSFFLLAILIDSVYKMSKSYYT